MPATLTRAIGNPSFGEHLRHLQQKKHNTDNENDIHRNGSNNTDCKNCNICRFNHLYVLGHNSQLPHSTSPSPALARMPRVTLSDGDRTLRLITIWLWLAGFPFLLAHGIVSHYLCPVLGIIPMTFSSITGLVHVTGKARNRGANIFVDVFVAAFLMGTLIPGWVFISEESYWRSNNGVTMVGTYGTVPMMADFVIHTFFVLREINWHKINPFTTTEDDHVECPHCHGDVNLVRSNKGKQPEAMSEHSSDSKESYQPVTLRDNAGTIDEYGEHEEEDRGRPSTDDETARLV